MAYPDLSETVNYLVDSANPTGYAQVIEERDGDGTLLKSYAIGDDVLLQSTRRSLGAGGPEFFDTSYFLYDGHGSTRQLVDESGDVTAQYAYDAYGVMLGQTAGAQQAQATSLLYSGERFDPALQHYYLRARDYNQANGQFTSLDPYSGNLQDGRARVLSVSSQKRATDGDSLPHLQREECVLDKILELAEVAVVPVPLTEYSKV